MTRKLLIIGIVWGGLVMAAGSSAWAGQGRDNQRHRDQKSCHQTVKTPLGQHRGWEKGRYNPHPSTCNNDRRYRHTDYHRRAVVEKHVHHYHVDRGYRDDNHFSLAVSVIDQVIGVAVAVSATH